MRRSLYIIISCTVFICTNAFASDPVVKVSSTIYPSFSQPDPMPGMGYGVINDLAVQAFKAVGTQVRIDFIPMARIVSSVTENNYDAALGTINWFAKEQKDHLVVPVDLLRANIVFFFKNTRFSDGIAYEQLAELKQFKVGCPRGSATIPLLEKAGITLELVAELDQNFLKLDAGHIDLTVAIDLTGLNIIRRLFPGTVAHYSIVKKPVLSIMTSLAFLNRRNAQIQSFKSGLDRILENGTFYEIIERYYGKDYHFEEILPGDLLVKMKRK